ncbi:uncharacterized protein FTOL_13931 [Fusarium torulosum]|uniref:Uncharacterized protein n=1 Tax=Fusarium torulosum TaxID=33205 RepID=A0AAE8MND1_9HYPO|nr:uncharacterized protein FTOL_13931 [Fusarium torulosum]
MTQSNKAF